MDNCKSWKILKERNMRPSYLPASWETCLQVKKQQLKPDMKQWTDSKLGQEYVKVVYCHPASLSHLRLFVTPWTAACQASLSITNSPSLLKLKSMESVMPSNYLILYHPLLFLPSIFSSIRISSMSQLFASKYWSFSSSISPSNEYSGLISFRMDWLDLLAVQGTLKNLLQHYSWKASIL